MLSIHRYDNTSFYPYSSEANFDYVGVGDAKGFNINIPWKHENVGDAEYIAAFFKMHNACRVSSAYILI